jgi:DNA-binding MarR family transcriptional regulator
MATVDAWEFTDVVTRLRRVLRTGVRGDFPWESLPMAQVEILQRLGDEPDLRVGELAARQRLATNTVSSLVQQLVGAGLVERGSDPADRRVATVRLTEAGRARLGEWLAAHERRVAAALDALDSEDRRTVLAALGPLSRLVDHLERLESSE